jgi:hypothetical protein
MTKWNSCRVPKGGLIYENHSIFIIYYKTHGHLNAERAFDKIQHLVIIKKKKSNPKAPKQIQQTRTRRKSSRFEKGYLLITHHQQYTQQLKTTSLPSKIKNKTRVTPLLFNTIL